MSDKVIRPTISELWRSLQEPRRKFPVGSEWQHYGGEVYEIIGHGIDEETGQPEVRYRRAKPLEDGRPQLRCNVGDFPHDYAREVEFHRSVEKFEAKIDGHVRRFVHVRRCEHYETNR